MSGIHPSLKSLAVDIDSLDYLEGNPRIGNVEAIMASYSEFGQVKPIVITNSKRQSISDGNRLQLFS